MFGNFTEEARNILVSAKKEMQDLKHPYVGSEHLLLSILNNNKEISKSLKKYGLDYKKLKEEIISIVGIGTKVSEWFIYTPLLKRVLENAIIDSKENNSGEVTVNHLFSSLLEEGEGVAIRIMLGMNIDLDSLYNEFSYKLVNNKKKKNKKLLIEELGIDLNELALVGKLDPVVGRDKEIKRVMEILSRRTKNNPILIGDAGVGKTAIVEELARKIVSGEVPISLKNKRIISLDMSTTVAGTKYRGEFEERIKKILKEIEENDDIILFIDEIHTLVGAGGAEGAIDASNIFKPALARNKLRCIGATTTDEYKKYIEEDSALERRFQKVLIKEPDSKIVKEILLKIKPIYEKFHKVIISEEMIDLIINLSKKYIYDRNEPDKSIDILDEVCASVSLKESKNLKLYNEYNKNLKEIKDRKREYILKQDFTNASNLKDEENKIVNDINNLEIEILKNNSNNNVTSIDIANVINEKTDIPVYELLNDDIKVINRIEKNISNKIIGQETAINEVLNITKKIKLGFLEDSKCYSMMFCGPSGVGKTELAKVFGESLVGNKNIIKLDMSEFSEAHTVSKIVGAPPGYVGYSDNKNILEEIRNKPYSVLILDEIEKAHSTIINLLFQIMDDGKIKDSKGKIIRFDNVVLVMTSNVGFNELNIGFSKLNNETVTTRLKENFSIPFINRIDDIVIFNALKYDDIKTIVLNKIKKLKNKYNKRNIKVTISNNVIDDIIILSNYEEYGARRIDKIIKDKLESIIIEGIVNNKQKIIIKNILELSKV